LQALNLYVELPENEFQKVPEPNLQSFSKPSFRWILNCPSCVHQSFSTKTLSLLTPKLNIICPETLFHRSPLPQKDDQSYLECVSHSSHITAHYRWESHSLLWTLSMRANDHLTSFWSWGPFRRHPFPAGTSPYRWCSSIILRILRLRYPY
jgi:hypothetical protein